MPRTFPDGEGIFETILTVDGEPQLLEDHLARARKSASYLGWNFPETVEIVFAIKKVLADIALTGRFGRLRLIFAPGGSVQVSMVSYERWTQPARLTVSTIPLDENSPLSGVKSLPYRTNVDLLKWAHGAGFDDAVQVNSKNEVAETSVANLLLKIKGEWITPPLSSGILPGIVRALALKCLPIQEATVLAEDLDGVESIFLLNSLKGFQPVISLDDRSLAIDSEIVKKAATFSHFG